VIAYTTYRDARMQAQSDRADDSTFDALFQRTVMQMVYFVSERLEQETCLIFAPRRETRGYAYNSPAVVTARTLSVDMPLLTLTTLTGADGVVITNSTLRPRNSTPKGFIWLPDGSAFAEGSAPDAEIEVTGEWGFRTGEGWISSLSSVQNDPFVSAAAAEITVNAADGVDVYLRQPRFAPGQLIRIEAEYVQVIDVDYTTHTLTVLRGQRGTTAAQHVKDTPIDLWEVEPTVQRAALVWTGLLLERIGSYAQASLDVSGGRILTYPKDMPDEVLGILSTLDTSWRRL
jgi:hypothetical protein